MNIIYYVGSFYVEVPQLSVILKITQNVGIITTIEVVEVMPNDNIGTYIDQHDILYQGVLENLKSFIKEFEPKL